MTEMCPLTIYRYSVIANTVMQSDALAGCGVMDCLVASLPVEVVCGHVVSGAGDAMASFSC